SKQESGIKRRSSHFSCVNTVPVNTYVELMPPLDTMTTWVINHGLKDGEDDLSHMRHEVSAWFRESLKPRWQPLPKHDQDYPDEAMVGLQRDSNSLPSEIKSINIIFIRFPSD
ncbi:hypothetical protein, partial [Aeromonas sp. QDB66]|uniref:hypothetical protein n=1 Tax=Aeromonas sp. QDB66 TaxID=2989824 RepID=UPI0022E5B7B7